MASTPTLMPPSGPSPLLEPPPAVTSRPSFPPVQPIAGVPAVGLVERIMALLGLLNAEKEDKALAVILDETEQQEDTSEGGQKPPTLVFKTAVSSKR